MKIKSAIILFVVLFLINYPIISMLNEPVNPATATGLLQEKIKFKTGSGDEQTDILVVKYNQASATTKLEINLDEECCELKARYDAEHENKLKYKEVSEDENVEKVLVATVKYSEDGDFKLYDVNDNLLWKVVVRSDKVKISDNEDNKNPYQIKMTKNNKIKIYDQGEEEKNVGVIKYKDGKLKVKVVVDEDEKEDLYSCKDLDAAYFAPGVLLFYNIPIKERAIIVAELLRKGK